MKLNFNFPVFNAGCIALVLTAIFVSCAKDNDLYNELAAIDNNQNLYENAIVDDNFTIIPGAIQILNVLKNDNFSDMQVITVTNVSSPTEGDVSINENNTLVYVAPDTGAETVDTFTYTTEISVDNGAPILETGNVTVVVSNDSVAKSLENNNYLFTEQAKHVLRERFQNEYVTGTGFTNDFARAKIGKDVFLANPSGGRPLYGDTFSIKSSRQVIHYAALFAYANDDVLVANAVMTEFLATAISNDLDDSWWSTNPNFSTDWDLWLQSASIKKMKDSYYLIKKIQTVLTDDDKVLIQMFFSKYAAHVRNWVNELLDKYWGANWENIGLSKFLGENLFKESANSLTSYPIENSNGVVIPEYTMTGAQNIFNNRTIESISYLHSWSISGKDVEGEFICREYFKNLIKYALLPDGSFWELVRNKNTYNINALGVLYSFSTLNAAVQMAHLDAMADHFPNDRLYDYETTNGIIKGSKNLTTNGYLGSSTTDGITNKSLKTFIIGQSKYYRNTANGGWNDVRFYGGSPLNMTGTSNRAYSTPQAIANLYYKDLDIADFYHYNTSVGYPAKTSFMDGSYFGSDGNIGTSLLGGAWFEQENNFFN